MSELKGGLYLKSIFWARDDMISSGRLGCESIVVRDQPGQMSMVPWAEVSYKDGRKVLYNLALVKGVTLLDEETDERKVK